jgi:hypothetical protein
MILALLLATALLPTALLLAQAPNADLANRVIDARRKDAAKLQQYNWNSRTEIVVNGKVADIRVDLVNLGADGHPQRTLLNDTPASMPGGFVRKRVAEDKRKDLEKYLKGLSKLVDQYTLPSAGKVIDFMAAAQILPVTMEGKTLLQVKGNSVVTDGDTLTITLDGQSFHTISLQISTFFESDPVTVTASYKLNAAGVNHLQYATAEIPGKEVTVMIHNYDYVPNN